MAVIEAAFAGRIRCARWPSLNAPRLRPSLCPGRTRRDAPRPVRGCCRRPGSRRSCLEPCRRGGDPGARAEPRACHHGGPRRRAGNRRARRRHRHLGAARGDPGRSRDRRLPDHRSARGGRRRRAAGRGARPPFAGYPRHHPGPKRGRHLPRRVRHRPGEQPNRAGRSGRARSAASARADPLAHEGRQFHRGSARAAGLGRPRGRRPPVGRPRRPAHGGGGTAFGRGTAARDRGPPRAHGNQGAARRHRQPQDGADRRHRGRHRRTSVSNHRGRRDRTRGRGHRGPARSDPRGRPGRDRRRPEPDGHRPGPQRVPRGRPRDAPRQSADRLAEGRRLPNRLVRARHGRTGAPDRRRGSARLRRLWPGWGDGPGRQGQQGPDPQGQDRPVGGRRGADRGRRRCRRPRRRQGGSFLRDGDTVRPVLADKTAAAEEPR